MKLALVSLDKVPILHLMPVLLPAFSAIDNSYEPISMQEF